MFSKCAITAANQVILLRKQENAFKLLNPILVQVGSTGNTNILFRNEKEFIIHPKMQVWSEDADDIAWISWKNKYKKITSVSSRGKY